MRPDRSSLRPVIPGTRAVTSLIAWVLVAAVAGCGSSAPSATVRPELAWSRAAFALPPDVVEVAPGTSTGIICSPCHAEQASLLTGVAGTDLGLLAVGMQLPPSSAVAYRSSDGRSWEPEPGFAAEGDAAAIAVAADDGRVVVVGRRGPAAAAWVAGAGRPGWQGAPEAPALRAPGGSAQMRAIVAWHGRFVAAGTRDVEGTSRSAGIWVSDDGLDWRVTSAGTAFDEATAYGIAASDDRIVVVGATGDDGAGPAAVWVSDDAETWTRVESPGFASGPMRAAAPTASGFIAVGFGVEDDRAVVWTSPDGRTWEALPPSRSLQNAGRPIRMTAVAWDGGRLVAAGLKSDAGNGSGVVWTSSDGSEWDRVSDQVSMSGASLSGVAFAGGAPVVVGTSGSPDNDQASAWYEGP